MISRLNEPSNPEYKCYIDQRGPVQVPESVKNNFNGKQKRAIIELENYFNRDSAMSLRNDTQTTDSTSSIQFKKTKIGFDKSKEALEK